MEHRLYIIFIYFIPCSKEKENQQEEEEEEIDKKRKKSDGLSLPLIFTDINMYMWNRFYTPYTRIYMQAHNRMNAMFMKPLTSNSQFFLQFVQLFVFNYISIDVFHKHNVRYHHILSYYCFFFLILQNPKTHTHNIRFSLLHVIYFQYAHRVFFLLI